MTVTVDLAQSTQFGAQLRGELGDAGRLHHRPPHRHRHQRDRHRAGALHQRQLAAARPDRHRQLRQPQGLQQLGNTQWAETFASGQALRGQAGNSGFGLVQSGALEGANVDITEQLVNMITAQRNFQANAQMISHRRLDHADHHQHALRHVSR